jgi:hypothetical protein
MNNSSMFDDAVLAARDLAGGPQWAAIERLLVARFCYTDRTTLVADSFGQTAFNEGQRALAIFLLSLPRRLTSEEQTQQEKGNAQ